MNREVIGKRVSVTTIFFNLILGLIKVSVGIVGKSSVLIADGIHSFSDLVTTIGVLIGFKLASKDADECHPYGHEKIEPIIAIILAIILVLTSIYISIEAIRILFYKDFSMPSQYTMYFALLSIVIKEIMFWYTRYYGKKIESPMLIADAWHHRSDALSSIAALIGIFVAVYFNIYIVEPIATIIIGIIIIKVGIEIFIQSTNQVIDSAANEFLINTIYSKINNINGIKQIDDLKTRNHVNKVYVEVEIAVDSELNIIEAHDIAEKVHVEVEKIDKNIKHCTVHVNPYFEPTLH